MQIGNHFSGGNLAVCQRNLRISILVPFIEIHHNIETYTKTFYPRNENRPLTSYTKIKKWIKRQN